MVITKPMLPPKKGYVEVEVDGKRTYKNVETGVLIENETTVEPTQLDLIEAQVTYTAMMTDTLLEG